MSSGRVFRLLGFGGSLRKASNSMGVLRYVQQNTPKGVDFKIANLRVPLYDADVDALPALPKEVETLRQQVKEADAILFSLPEYNYGIPGVVKNAIDWVSRPGKDGSPQPFRDKPFGMISSGGFMGGYRSQIPMRQVAVFLEMHALNRPELAIRQYEAPAKFDQNGNLIDAASQKLTLTTVNELIAWAVRLNPEKKL